jgi:hypothetical protein
MHLCKIISEKSERIQNFMLTTANNTIISLFGQFVVAKINQPFVPKIFMQKDWNKILV